MTGVLCMQGGHEFTVDCLEMDAEVLERIGASSVAVLAGAARPGSDYDGASGRAQRHYAKLDADVAIIPDPRAGEAAALAAMTDDIGLVVLPGGSPSNLIEMLRTPVGERLAAMHANGTAISGASAGAMVMCTSMVRPQTATGADITTGLGLVDGLALPHWSPTSTRGWPVPDDIRWWGLPECGGVIIEAGADPIAVGHGDASVHVDGTWTELPR